MSDILYYMLNNVRFIFVAMLVQYFRSLSNLLSGCVVFLVFPIRITYMN